MGMEGERSRRVAVFKWTGAILVLFSAGGLGIWSAMQWKGRLRMLETLRQMIYFLKGEITYSRTPLPPFHMSKQRRISSHVYHIGIAFQSGHERSFH